MKKSLIILAVSLFLIHPVFPQQKRALKSWKTFVSIGYGSTESSSFSKYYKSLIDSYRFSGVPINTQREFGPTLLANTGFIFNFLENIGAGISLGYFYSPAYSNYKDYAGIVKINGSISNYDILLNVYYIVQEIGKFPIVINPKIGFSHSSILVTQEVRFNNFQEYNYNRKLTNDGWGPCAQFTIGTSVNLGNYYVNLEAGYRWAWIIPKDQMEVSITGTDKAYEVTDIGLIGIISSLSFGIKF